MLFLYRLLAEEKKKKKSLYISFITMHISVREGEKKNLIWFINILPIRVV